MRADCLYTGISSGPKPQTLRIEYGKTFTFLPFTRTAYILSPYCICSLYADSAEVRTVIWSAQRVRTPWTEYVYRRRQYTERVRSQYGLTLSAASAAYVKHEITFKIGLPIAADRDGNPQTQYGYSTHTVRIPGRSRRMLRDPQHPCVGVKGVLDPQLLVDHPCCLLCIHEE